MGESENWGSAADGYRIPGYKHRTLAVYMPEYHQIWTNPAYEKSEIEDILWEEFAHGIQTFLRPSQLLPLRNHLTGTDNHPGHEEFRDIVEAVSFAAYPLATNDTIDPRNPPDIYSPYEGLGIRILEETARLAEHCAHRPGSQRARREALWSLTTALYSVVPLARRQAPVVLVAVHEFEPESGWDGRKDLFEMLLVHLGQYVTQREESGGLQTFTIMRPNNPHELVVRCVDLILDFAKAPFDKILPAVPVLLSALSLGIHRNLYLFWLHEHGGDLEASLEVWPFREDNISTTSQILRSQGIFLVPPVSAGLCPAYYVYANVLVFCRKLNVRSRTCSPAYFANEMLELLIYFLKTVLLPTLEEGLSCPNCRSCFEDEQFEDAAGEVATLSGPVKTRLVGAAARYPTWLQQDSGEEMAEKLGFHRDISLSDVHMAPLAPAYESPGVSPTLGEGPEYSFPAPGGEEWARFLPALGQIWIMPGCPERLSSLIRTHEIQHARLTALAPSQCLPLSHALLQRRMPQPDRFREIVEAGYVLGLTTGSGYPPKQQYFPPAPERDIDLAKGLAEAAWQIADTADPSLDNTEAAKEAAKALIFVTHQTVMPKSDGVGEDLTKCLKKVRPPKPWKNASELRPMLFAELHEMTGEQHGFYLMLPPDPHRLVVDMLNFLCLALQPIPEREEAVLQTFPVLLNVLMVGSLGCVPLIKLKKNTFRYDAEISVLHSEPVKEHEIQKTLRVHPVAPGNQSYGEGCVCTGYWKKILEMTEEPRQSQLPDRLFRCARKIIDATDLSPFQATDFSCAACQYHLNHQKIRDDIESIRMTWEESHGRILRAAQDYEDWLLSGGMKILRRELELQKPVSTVKRYQYL